tara:strand:+ start:1607 stop:2335 length:729 start_codon:yes stop_codon:yes gene_type:complete
MVIHYIYTFIFISSLIFSSQVFAQSSKSKLNLWSGKTSMGYLATSGNTDNKTLNTSFELGYTVDKITHLAEAFAINASESENTSAEAYELRWKSELKLNNEGFLFGRLQWRKDRFGGYSTQFSQTIGYGNQLINNIDHNLNAEVGAGARQSETQLGIEGQELVGRLGFYYKWQFSKTAEFRQNVTTEVGKTNTYSESVTAISAKLIGDLALVASFTIKNNSDVPLLIKKTDTYTALSLEYLF